MTTRDRPTRRQRPAERSRSPAVVALTAAAAALVSIAGCGSTQAPRGAGHSDAQAGIPAAALATTLASSNGTSWAVLELGGAAATENNFWELFVRRPGGAGWQLATPEGVASNGGLVAATTATGPLALTAGFRPSQNLTFSPLASTADAGLDWQQANVLGAGLANLPGALAAAPGGRLLALTEDGVVEEGAALGASWSRLTSLPALAKTAAIKADCSLTALTAVAWTTAGDPLLGGNCAAPDRGTAAAATERAGIFVRSGNGWQPAGPQLPATLPRGPVTVLALAVSGRRTTAILAVGTGAATSVAAAWSADGGASWTVSAGLRAGAAAGRRSRSPPTARPGSCWLAAGPPRSAGRPLAGAASHRFRPGQRRWQRPCRGSQRHSRRPAARSPSGGSAPAWPPGRGPGCKR